MVSVDVEEASIAMIAIRLEEGVKMGLFDIFRRKSKQKKKKPLNQRSRKC